MSTPFLVGQDEITKSYDPIYISNNKLYIANYVWDSGSMAWVKAQASAGGPASDVNVLNFPSTYPVTQSGVWTFSVPLYTKRYEQVSKFLAYLGEALPGSSEASFVWRIQKLDFTAGGNVTATFADGDDSFDNQWSNRASLSYS